MQIETITVRHLRRRQAAQYEPVESEVTLSASLEPGDDPDLCLKQLTYDAKKAVSDSFGLDTSKTRPVADPVAAEKEAKMSAAIINAAAPDVEVVLDEADTADPGDASSDLDKWNDLGGDRQISETPEDRVESDLDALLSDDEPEETYTYNDLGRLVSSCIENRKLTVAQVKEMMASMGVDSLKQLKSEDIPAFYRKVEEKAGV